MKYVSLDIETTGLNPEVHQILEVAMVLNVPNNAVIDLPYFQTLVDPGCIHGDPVALAKNADILREIADPSYDDKASPFTLWLRMAEWLLGHYEPNEKILLAGKNVGSFDLQFLKRIPMFLEQVFHHRVLDPGMLYLDPELDNTPPNLETCLSRAGYTPSVSHRALDDARDVIYLLRNKGI